MSAQGKEDGVDPLHPVADPRIGETAKVSTAIGEAQGEDLACKCGRTYKTKEHCISIRVEIITPECTWFNGFSLLFSDCQATHPSNLDTKRVYISLQEVI